MFHQFLVDFESNQLLQMRSENCEGISVVPSAINFNLLDPKVKMSEKLSQGEGLRTKLSSKFIKLSVKFQAWG